MNNIIRNPKYKGFYCGRKYSSIDYRNNKKIKLDSDEWIVYKDERIPAIVSEDIWDHANRLISERGKKAREHGDAYQSRYPYSGKLFCAEHGTSYHRHIYKSKKCDKEVWNCKLYRLKGKKDGCDSPTIYTSELNEVMSNIYKLIYPDNSLVISELILLYSQAEDYKDYQKLIKNKESEINIIHQKKDKILELHIDGLINKTEFVNRNNRLNKELAETEKQINHIKSQIKILMGNKNTGQIQSDLNKLWNDGIDVQNYLSTIILDKIIVYKTGDKSLSKLEIRLKCGDSLLVEYWKKDGIITSYKLPIKK